MDPLQIVLVASPGPQRDQFRRLRDMVADLSRLRAQKRDPFGG